MKAVDILRNHIRDLEKMVLVFDEYAMYKSRDESKKAIQELTQVIVELEDLQNRSCANCKYNKEQDNFMIFCDKTMCQDGSKMMWHSFTKDFNCKYWEPKQ